MMNPLIVIGPVVLLLLVLGFVTYAIYFERKIIGWIQSRVGPNQVGPFGLLQTVADVMKLWMKEDIIPQKADKFLFQLAPIVAFVPSFVVLGRYSFYRSDQICGFGRRSSLLFGGFQHHHTWDVNRWLVIQ